MTLVASARYESTYSRALRERALTHPDTRAPFVARGMTIVTVSAVIEAGVVRAIGYGWGSFTLMRYWPYVEAIYEHIGKPGMASEPYPVEWTANVYRIPQYVMDAINRDAIPRGIYLYPRIRREGISGNWSFEFERDGKLLGPLPKGW